MKTLPGRNRSVSAPTDRPVYRLVSAPLNAHAFVLSRADEYEADAHAARLVDGEHVTSSLVRMQTQTLARLRDPKL